MGHSSRRVIAAALFVNLAIEVAKIVAFDPIVGAASMLAEASMLAKALHSLADSTNQGLLFLGSSESGRAPTAEHPCGYGRERYFWTFVVALVIFAAGSMFALFARVQKLRHPHRLESVGWAVDILIVSLALEGFRFAPRCVKPVLCPSCQRGWTVVAVRAPVEDTGAAGGPAGGSRCVDRAGVGTGRGGTGPRHG
jgi:hypothetical protein